MGCAFGKRRPLSADNLVDFNNVNDGSVSPVSNVAHQQRKKQKRDSHDTSARSSGSVVSKDDPNPKSTGKIPVLQSIFSSMLTMRYQKQTNKDCEHYARYEHHQTRETKKVRYCRDADGNKMVNQYTLLKVLGSGVYGKVKLVLSHEDNLHYAIKIMKKKNLMKRKFGLKKSTAWDDVMREISIMKQLDHKNVLRLVEVINDPNDDKIYLVLEYAEGGAVQKSENDTEPVSENKIRKYFVDVVAGLEYLHSHGVIHRDIKPENLLIGSNDTIKIADFGVSIILDPTNDSDDDEILKKTVGSPAFLAPELCASEQYKIYGPALDIWSLGVTLFFFIYGKIPFTGETEAVMYENIRTQEVSFPHPIGHDLEDLLNKLMTKDPEQRIKIGEIMVHPWVTKTS